MGRSFVKQHETSVFELSDGKNEGITIGGPGRLFTYQKKVVRQSSRRCTEVQSTKNAVFIQYDPQRMTGREVSFD